MGGKLEVPPKTTIRPNTEVIMNSIEVLVRALDSEDERTRVDAAVALLNCGMIDFS